MVKGYNGLYGLGGIMGLYGKGGGLYKRVLH